MNARGDISWRESPMGHGQDTDRAFGQVEADKHPRLHRSHPSLPGVYR